MDNIKNNEMNARPVLSAVISCYFEQESIDEFYHRLSLTLNKMNLPYEIIFVNDGSTDDTFQKLTEIFEKDPRVSCIINLFKNSGQSAGATAGLSQAQGQHVIFMDSDLQFDPEELPVLYKSYTENNVDITTGYRENRRDSLLRRLVSFLANNLTRSASEVKIRDLGCTYRIINANLIRAFGLGPYNIINSFNIFQAADSISEVSVSHHPRKYGKSGWSLMALSDFNMENLINMMNRPFQYIVLALFLMGFLLIGRVALDFLFPVVIFKTVTMGFLLNIILIGAFIQLAILCLIGELVLRSLRTVKGKPQYIIKEKRRHHALNHTTCAREI